MAISYQVFTNVSSVALGSAAIEGVLSVRVMKRRAEVRAGGDGDLYEPVADVGPCGVSGTIVTLDPTDAQAIDGQRGTLSFVWSCARGQADKTVTIANVVITGTDGTVRHDKASLAAASFIASSPDGITDPVSIA